MEPFFFNQDSLFGVYHSAIDFDSGRLVVICPPLFDEYRRSYRAMYQLAQACAQKGWHVMRFDYYGTGDSKGDFAELEGLTRWVKDIDAAIDEGVAVSGAHEVVLIGIRFGASLASMSAHSYVKRMIFWDLIDSGCDYLEWLDQVEQWLYQDHRKASLFVNSHFELSNATMFELNSSMIGAIGDWHYTTCGVPVLNISSGCSDNVADGSVNVVNLEYQYSWPEYENGLIRPGPVFKSILESLQLDNRSCSSSVVSRF